MFNLLCLYSSSVKYSDQWIKAPGYNASGKATSVIDCGPKPEKTLPEKFDSHLVPSVTRVRCQRSGWGCRPWRWAGPGRPVLPLSTAEPDPRRRSAGVRRQDSGRPSALRLRRALPSGQEPLPSEEGHRRPSAAAAAAQQLADLCAPGASGEKTDAVRLSRLLFVSKT